MYGQELGAYLNRILPSLFALVQNVINNELNLVQNPVEKDDDDSSYPSVGINIVRNTTKSTAAVPPRPVAGKRGSNGKSVSPSSSGDNKVRQQQHQAQKLKDANGALDGALNNVNKHHSKQPSSTQQQQLHNNCCCICYSNSDCNIINSNNSKNN